jgi:hypothetical protein
MAKLPPHKHEDKKVLKRLLRLKPKPVHPPKVPSTRVVTSGGTITGNRVKVGRGLTNEDVKKERNPNNG